MGDLRNLFILIGLVLLLTFLSTCTVMMVSKASNVKIDHQSEIKVDSINVHKGAEKTKNRQ